MKVWQTFLPASQESLMQRADRNVCRTFVQET